MIYQAPQAPNRGRWYKVSPAPENGLLTVQKRTMTNTIYIHQPEKAFTFCFLPPVNSGGTAGAVFCPVGFGDEYAAADRTAFQVLIPENLRFQRPVQRQNRPAEHAAGMGQEAFSGRTAKAKNGGNA